MSGCELLQAEVSTLTSYVVNLEYSQDFKQQ